MSYTKGTLIAALACCLALPACFDSSSNGQREAFVPESITLGSMPRDAALALTADSDLPDSADIDYTGQYVLTETSTGIVIEGELTREGILEAMAETISGRLEYRYEDNGLLGSYLVTYDDEYVRDNYRISYGFSGDAMVRRTVMDLGDSEASTPYLMTLIAGEPVEGGLLFRQYSYQEEDGYGADHDESSDEIDDLMEARFDGQGRLAAQVFYDTTDPAEALPEDARSVVTFEYDDSGRVTAQRFFIFSGDSFDGDLDALDTEHAAYDGAYLIIYDADGNERYWIRDFLGEECLFAAFSWKRQALSPQAAAFMDDEVRLVDAHPEWYYFFASTVPLWAFLLGGPF